MSIDLRELEGRFPSHISALHEVHRLTGELIKSERRVTDLEAAQDKNRPVFKRMQEEIRQLRDVVAELGREASSSGAL